MTAPRVAQQPVAHRPIQAIESLAHVGRTRGKINPRRRAKAEHTYSLSSTSTTCASVSPSKPRPTSTLRPFDNNTVNTTACFRAASGANVAANSTDTRRLASPSLRALCPGSSACLFRWRLSVLNDIPCLRQNSLRLIPLVPYKLARRTTSARPRRRTTSPDSSTMERVHHRSTALYRCVPRTLTLKKRFTQRQLITFTANLQTTLIGLEACAGAHFLGRALREQGHDVKLIPAQFVRPFVKSNKNDLLDAEAIAEAVDRQNMRFVPIKTDDQLDLQALHRVRDRLITRRTSVINQLRAFLLERHMSELLAAGKGVYSELLNLCVWTKDNADMAAFIAAATNSCLSSRMERGSIKTMFN